MQTDRGTAGAYLERLLEKRGWKPATLAAEADVPASSVSRLLNGTSTISVDTARKLATALKVPVREFVVKVGLFSPQEMDAPVQAATALVEASNSELLAEVGRRMKDAAGELQPPTVAEIAADPERFVVVDPRKKDPREPGSTRRKPS